MRSLGGVIIAATAIGISAWIAHSILKASDDIADQFSDFDEIPTGSHPFVPVEHFPGQSRIAGDFSFWGINERN